MRREARHKKKSTQSARYFNPVAHSASGFSYPTELCNSCDLKTAVESMVYGKKLSGCMNLTKLFLVSALVLSDGTKVFPVVLFSHELCEGQLELFLVFKVNLLDILHGAPAR